MAETPRLLNLFSGIAIVDARVDSRVDGGVMLVFRLSPTPIPAQWRLMFSQISSDNHGSMMSTSKPILHGEVIVWEVSEGDIPNAKRFVDERVEHANTLFDQMLIDEAKSQALRALERTSQAEIDRLQAILDHS